jgi:hypothetical protein
LAFLPYLPLLAVVGVTVSAAKKWLQNLFLPIITSEVDNNFQKRKYLVLLVLLSCVWRK